jgi:hypothetical protein
MPRLKWPSRPGYLVAAPPDLHKEVARSLTSISTSKGKLRPNDKHVLDLASRYGILGDPDHGSSLLAWAKAALLAQVVQFYSYLIHLEKQLERTNPRRRLTLQERRRTRPAGFHRILDRAVVQVRTETHSVSELLRVREALGSAGAIETSFTSRALGTRGRQVMLALLEHEITRTLTEGRERANKEINDAAGTLAPAEFFALSAPTRERPFPWTLSTTYVSLLLELHAMVLSGARVWECEGCSRLITTSRRNQTHCGGNCRQKARRTNLALAPFE